MIFEGKSIQSVANATIYPFLNDLLKSEDETVVRETLNYIKILADLGVQRKNFLEMQRLLCHKNINIARNSLNILRDMSPDVVNKEADVKADVWKSLYPLFCNQALSTPAAAIDSLKILDVLVDHEIVGDYRNLQKALLHESDTVAHLAIDLLRRIKEKDQKIKETEQLTQKGADLQSRISYVLKKNPKYIESLREIKSKYNV
ncbi:MAG: hypothetical protein O8C66_04925 [Candidatus Methanoperedens sp.]|nr:hypothetical protein [Candidatus Methanoperedens sp.]MCZ7369832.1 hypothetical protein [Candidatus Methanoperedens sp.]